MHRCREGSWPPSRHFQQAGGKAPDHAPLASRPGQLRGHHVGGAARVPGLAHPIRDDSSPADVNQERPAEIELPLSGRAAAAFACLPAEACASTGAQTYESLACACIPILLPERHDVLTPKAAPRCTPLRQRGSLIALSGPWPALPDALPAGCGALSCWCQLAGGVRRSRRMIRRSWVIRAVPAAAIRLVRMPLTRVRIRPVLGGLGAGEGGELEPLAEGGGSGSVLVVPRGDSGGSVMAVVPSPVRASR